MATPFIFYIYKYAPSGTKEWDTIFGTITANGFTSAKSFAHAVFTKLTFVMLTGIWFLTSKNWWKFAILVPLTLFLFQLFGVLNQELQYIDEYDFWYSLPVVLPVLFFMTYISYRMGKRSSEGGDLKKQADEEIKNIFSDKL
ncbi:MAG: hypothetical protein AAF489_13145 [Bacteroidota bacterium]